MVPVTHTRTHARTATHARTHAHTHTHRHTPHSVPTSVGTDLLGDMHRHQLMEFGIRAQVQPCADVIRGATCTAAELLGHSGKLGVVVQGARADLILVDGNPLEDLAVLQEPEQRLRLVMKAGVVHKNLQPTTTSCSEGVQPM